MSGPEAQNCEPGEVPIAMQITDNMLDTNSSKDFERKCDKPTAQEKQKMLNLTGVIETSDKTIKSDYDLYRALMDGGYTFPEMERGNAYKKIFADALNDVRINNPHFERRSTALAFIEDAYSKVIESLLDNQNQTDSEFINTVQKALHSMQKQPTVVAMR